MKNNLNINCNSVEHKVWFSCSADNKFDWFIKDKYRSGEQSSSLDLIVSMERKSYFLIPFRSELQQVFKYALNISDNSEGNKI